MDCKRPKNLGDPKAFLATEDWVKDPIRTSELAEAPASWAIQGPKGRRCAARVCENYRGFHSKDQQLQYGLIGSIWKSFGIWHIHFHASSKPSSSSSQLVSVCPVVAKKPVIAG